MTGPSRHGNESRDEVRAAAARLEAAVNELAAVAGAQAVRYVEHAVARLRAGTRSTAPEEASAPPPQSSQAPPRQPLWLWSNKPRSRKLYRSPRRVGDGKLLGVCAGVANLYGLEPFIVRLALVALFFFTQGAALIAYVVAAIIMDTEPEAEATARRNGDAAAQPRATRESAADAPAANTAQPTPTSVRAGFAALEQRLRRIEYFVTSDQFDLHREFAKIGAPGAPNSASTGRNGSGLSAHKPKAPSTGAAG